MIHVLFSFGWRLKNATRSLCNKKRPVAVDFYLAEGVRFELTVVIRHAGFQDRCLKPLGHPSNLDYFTIKNALSSKDGRAEEGPQ